MKKVIIGLVSVNILIGIIFGFLVVQEKLGIKNAINEAYEQEVVEINKGEDRFEREVVLKDGTKEYINIFKGEDKGYIVDRVGITEEVELDRDTTKIENKTSKEEQDEEKDVDIEDNKEDTEDTE